MKVNDLDVYGLLAKVREKKPLVHHITNWVTIYDCANIVRVFGGLPIMAHAPEESGDMAAISDALVLNIGTLTTSLIESMKIAAKSANKKDIPVILDAVGAGATKFRDEKALELINECKINVIKGNASEIGRLAGEDVKTKGVEATDVKIDLIETAKKLSKSKKSTVIITGAHDIVTNEKDTYLIKNGHKMMGSFVGTGCLAASIIGCFCGVEKDYTKAAVGALACFGIAGELAARNSNGPASFKERLFDEIYNLTEENVEKMQKIDKILLTTKSSYLDSKPSNGTSRKI